MTPRDRRKLAEAVAERLGIEVRHRYEWPGGDSFAVGPHELRLSTSGRKSRMRGQSTWWLVGPTAPVPRLTGRGWVDRTADAIAEAVRAAARPAPPVCPPVEAPP